MGEQITFRDSARNIARRIFTAGVRPLGAARVLSLFSAGLPESFRLPLEYLFAPRLSPTNANVRTRVEALRAEIANSGRTFHVISSQRSLVQHDAYHIAYVSSIAPEWGVFLNLCSKSLRAQTILELGSCAGISGSYLAATPFCKNFIGVEASDDLIETARANVRRILPGAVIEHGLVEDVFDSVVARLNSGIDLCYVDSNHHYEPTLRQMDRIAAHLNSGCLVIFDDIHWSKEMWDAWCILRTRQGFSHTLDVGRLGICLWQGGTVCPKNYELAWYSGWVRKYHALKREA